MNSGSEANDLATLLAKAYTGNNDIISLQNSYHGCSSGLMALTGTQSYRMPVPAPSGFHHVSWKHRMVGQTVHMMSPALYVGTIEGRGRPETIYNNNCRYVST